MAPANRAMMPAPTTPASTPAAIQAPRPAAPREAAMTMPMISPASSTSRKTMTSAPSMLLFRDHDALGRVCVELAHELVTPGVERPDPHQAFRFARDDLFDLECGTVELLRRGVLVADVDGHPFAGGHPDLLRLELVVPDHQIEFLGERGRVQDPERRQHHRKNNTAHHV